VPANVAPRPAASSLSDNFENDQAFRDATLISSTEKYLNLIMNKLERR
jgi:hypothetical protein